MPHVLRPADAWSLLALRGLTRGSVGSVLTGDASAWCARCVCSHRTKDSRGHEKDGLPDTLHVLQRPRWRVVLNLLPFFLKTR